MTALTDLAVELLAAPNHANLAVVTDEGPHVSPVWVDSSEGLVRFNIAGGRVKLRALEHDPRVCISVMDRDDEERSVVMFGHVVSIEQDRNFVHADQLARKYGRSAAWPTTAGYRRFVVSVGVDRVIDHT